MAGPGPGALTSGKGEGLRGFGVRTRKEGFGRRGEDRAGG